MLSQNSEAFVVAIIFFITGIYSILSGILALAQMSIKIPGFYQLGVFISNILNGKVKTANFEKEMLEPKKAARYGIIWILSGLVAVAGGIFILFLK